MNRFDQVSVNAYTPQSMQELAFTPLMKRQKHDEMSKNLAELSAIATDPLNEHRDRALELKNDLESKLGNLYENLATRGIDSIGVSDFYKLKKERDNLIAPTGEIGIINEATKAMALEKEIFYKNADKQFGQNRLDEAWLQHRAEYTKNLGRDNEGKITNIGSLGSPKYIDREKTVTNLLSTVGHETTNKLINSGQKFVMTPYGVGTKDTQGNITTKTNDKQLQNVLDSLSSQFFVKGSEGRISGDFEKRSLQNDIDYINGRVLGAKIYEKETNQKTNYGWTPQGSSSNGDSDKSLTPLISIQNEIQSKEFANQKYSENLKEYKRLSLIPEDKRSEEDNVKFTLLKNLQKDVDKNLKNTKAYKENQPKIDAFDNKIDILYRKTIQDAGNMSAEEYDKAIENITKQELAKIKTPEYLISGRKGIVSINVRSKMNDLLKQREEIYKPITEVKNKLTALNNRQFFHYALAPITEKEQGQYQNLNNNLATAVKSSPSALSNLGLIESVDLAKGSKKYKLTEEQRSQIQTLLYNSDRKNIRLESISEKGPGGKPQLRIAFTPNEDDDLDLEGVNWFGKNSDNLNNKEIYLNLAVNNLTNAKAGGPGIKNIVGLIVNYIGERGEKTENNSTEGYDIAKSFINHAYGINN